MASFRSFFGCIWGKTKIFDFFGVQIQTAHTYKYDTTDNTNQPGYEI